tara:strand:- start:156 stop:686 length:531 start_codon:yes stop_codon:yes gene_type:complete
MNMLSNYKQKLKNIKAFVLDVDGVLTNGELYIHPDGTLMRKMNAKDGYILKLAITLGYKIAIITGGREKEIKKRLKKLGVHEVFLNCHDKLPVLIEFMRTYQFSQEEILYMGDDIPDIESLKHVGFSCCPNNAAHDVKLICDYISHKNGGEGCVREIIEQTLKASNKWNLNGKIKY